MKEWTRVGIIILIIGVSLLAGTLYRSNKTDGASSLIVLAPNTSSLSTEEMEEIEGLRKTVMEAYSFLWTPREVRLEVRATAAIDVYILGSEEIKQWEKDKTVKALWAFKETKQDIYTLQIPKRDKYMILLYNPTNETVTSELDITIYGIENDLLHTSMALITTGLVLTAASVIITRKPFHNQFKRSTKKRGKGSDLHFSSPPN